MIDSALVGLRLALVGPGHVGQSLAQWARNAGATVGPVSGRTGLAEFDSSRADGLLIAVPDTALDEVAAVLAARPQAAAVLHVSGSRGASALQPLRERGCAVGSLHPLAAFPSVLATPPAGLVFGVDGDPAALGLAGRLAAAWEAEAAPIPEPSRLLYHFAATLAAGGATTLLGLAAELARDLDLPAAVGRGYRALARGAVAAFDPADPERAITGPVRRGDVELVSSELAALGQQRPDLVPLAHAVASASLDLLARRSGLSPAQRRLRDQLGSP